MEKESELHPGIENRSHSNSNIYEYRDTPSLSSNKTKPLSISKMGSTRSSRTDLTKAASVQSVRSSDCILSLQEHQNLANMFSATPRPVAGREYRNKLTELRDGIPQTAV